MSYQRKNFDSLVLQTESGPIPTVIKVDSLGYATIQFGSDYTLRLSHEELTGLAIALENTESELQEIIDYGFSE